MKQLLAIKKENVGSEKQVNKLNKFLVLQNNIRIILALILFGSFYNLQAQDRVPYDQGTKYILANVDVTGKINFNAQTVVTFAGLEKGQNITVPGEEISAAIKKLAKLGLFKDIDFYTSKVVGDSIYLELNINELPKLGEVKFKGVKKGKVEELIKENSLTKGKVVNENLLTTTKNYIENKYKKDGFFNTKVNINTVVDTSTVNEVNMVVNIDKGDKIKISTINFTGNNKFSEKKLRSAMSNTKKEFPGRFWKGSKYIKSKYQEDLVSIVDEYKSKGYRDARVISDTVVFDDTKKKLAVKIKVEEGNKYYFGNIKFIGNTVYSDNDLRRMLGLNKGDVYNGVELAKRIADKSKPDGEDITNLYQNTGYLFSNINPVEVRTANDSIDFEIRINEGPIAYFNKISVVGNDKTNDKVIYRELRTKPGQKYSKEELVRTIREIGQLGFFDPEAIKPDFKNVDANAGTVDIQYNLVEKGASQIELQGGYGGSGFIGTLGLSFNNFSARNLFKKDAYKPLPMGDGQKMALRLQASGFFQTYSLSFTEPWFGGKKPIQFQTSIAQTKQFGSSDGRTADKNQSFNLTTLSVGIAKRLSAPDDFFVLSHTVSFQYYDLNNFSQSGLFTFKNGSSRNLSYTIGLSRNNKGTNPIFPTYGSEFSISGKFTPPYSLFTKLNVNDLRNSSEYKLRLPESNSGIQIYSNDLGLPIPGDYVKITNFNNVPGYEKATISDASPDVAKVDQKQFNFLEYYKIKIKADWFTKLAGKLVLRSIGEFGFLGRYNTNRDEVPFERFALGGNGLQGFNNNSQETIGLRGYKDGSLSPSNGGGTIYNKYSLELRYPITLKSAASIYALSFLEGGSSFTSFKNYNPFAIQRSAGVGLRIFMPAFGLLGIDFAYGFDKTPGSAETGAHGWEQHFIIGQQF
jgi:outer membrane protein insertion porin family